MRTAAVLIVLLICLPAAGAVGRGIAQPGRQAALHPAVGGVLSEVAVEGDRVSAGDVLARVDDAVAAAQVRAARLRAAATADRDRAAIAQEQARRVLERTRAAAADGAAEDWEVREAQVAHALAEAALRGEDERLALAAADLTAAEAALDRHALRAGFDGEVVRVAREAGASVAPGEAVLELADLTTLRAEVYLPATTTFDVGSTRTLRTSLASAPSVEARVVYVDPRIDPASGRRRCVFEIANPDRRLPSGFEVTVDDDVVEG